MHFVTVIVGMAVRRSIRMDVFVLVFMVVKGFAFNAGFAVAAAASGAHIVTLLTRFRVP
jgi:hypothetical protein